jgi:HTH-type transcriptional regulator/antitoxin HigA
MKPIRTEEDYHMALVRLQLLKDAKPNTPEADEYEVINILLEHYERENAPMGMPDPLDSIKIFNEYFTDKDEDLNEEE